MGGARKHTPARPACRQVPRSYLSLQEAVLAEQQRRRLGDDVQYLTDRQLQQLVDQTPGNDIDDYEDLQSGGRGRGRSRGRGRQGWGPQAGSGRPHLLSVDAPRASIWGPQMEFREQADLQRWNPWVGGVGAPQHLSRQ